MQRKASAVWQGGLKDGKGSLTSDSGVLKQTQYSFSTRFENGAGTNRGELLAAAHAGCFTMALSAQLGNAGMTATKLETTATVTLDKVGDGFSITKSHLDLVANIPGADKTKFDAAVKAAETGCPVSKLFKAEISVSARLESSASASGGRAEELMSSVIPAPGEFLAGVVLFLIVVWDAFEAIILPRRVTRKFRLTRLFFRF